MGARVGRRRLCPPSRPRRSLGGQARPTCRRAGRPRVAGGRSERWPPLYGRQPWRARVAPRRRPGPRWRR